MHKFRRACFIVKMGFSNIPLMVLGFYAQGLKKRGGGRVSFWAGMKAWRRTFEMRVPPGGATFCTSGPRLPVAGRVPRPEGARALTCAPIVPRLTPSV